MSTLSPILGHQRVLAQLEDAADTDHWHHAYLFEGPPGVGKDLVATRLAMRANCEAEPGIRPCGTCGTCKRIAMDNHPDVIRVRPAEDRASRTISVAQIREVIRAAAYHRYDARQRFVIIDPAEAMPPAASNALLKTLEEPPAGTGFILVATHASTLLPTIRSRCQRVRFGPVALAELTDWLSERGVEQAARIARLAEGCPGRALSLAEGELQARVERRDAVLQAIAGDLDTIFSFSESLCKGSRATWSPKVDLVLDLLDELLRDAVLFAANRREALLHDDVLPVIEAWSGALWPSGIPRCQQAIVDTRADLAVNVSGKTTLDALITKLATELGTARKAGVAPA